MAIYHLSTKNVSRSSGRSAVAAAAYRAGARLKDNRTGKIHDYRRRRGVVHTAIVLPEQAKSVRWALNRSKLWNTAEKSEKRKDARTAKEIVIALPHELDAHQRKELTMEMAQKISDKYGVAVDVAIHTPTSSGSSTKSQENEEEEYHPPNHHAHLLMTTREVEKNGLSKEKAIFGRDDAWLRKNKLPTGSEQVQELRRMWEELANEHLAEAGHDVRIDRRSHAERGFKVKPTHHVGPHAAAMERRGEKVHRQRLHEDEKEYNADTIYAEPEEILKIITSELSVFSHQDVARYVHRAVQDKYFQQVFDSVMVSSELVKLQPDSVDATGKPVSKYSTREMIDIEGSIADNAAKLSHRRHRVSQWKVRKAIARENKELKATVGSKLSREQRKAIKHVTGRSKITAVVGHAGSGKSTMLAAARAAWEANGFNVVGAAIAGKAVDGLQQSAGIKSRTLASLQLSWRKGSNQLKKNDVLVVDEAGMLDSRQLASIISQVEKSGAKLVLVGDHGQLQPIGPGAGFRAIVDRIGCAELTEIRRQHKRWQRGASRNLAEGQTDIALKKYEKHGRIQICHGRIQTIKALAMDYLAEAKSNPDQTMLAIAHRRKDVQMLNTSIRSARKIAGHLKDGVTVRTSSGYKTFAAGDRIMLMQNDQNLGVKNGMLGTVRDIGRGRIRIVLDDSKREVRFKIDEYRSFDYGYASTAHKAQGATVDQSFVLAGKTMDWHLAYVAMTRHKSDTRIYADRQDFRNLDDLSWALSRDRSKETTLDYRDGFNRRRSINATDLEAELLQFPDRDWSGKRSKRTVALDYFACAMEEYLWIEYHGIEPSKIQRGKLDRAEEMLDRASPNLSNLVMMCINYDSRLKNQILDLSGEERVNVLETAIKDFEWDIQFKQMKSDDTGYRSEFKPDPKDEPDYTYRPGPNF